MRRKRIPLYLLITLLGVGLLLAGKIIFTGEDVKNLSGMCFGIGAAAFVLGLGSFVGALTAKTVETEAVLRQKQIEVSDERNEKIREKSAASTLKVLQYILYAATLILGFTSAPVPIVILMACISLAPVILLIYYSNYYEKML